MFIANDLRIADAHEVKDKVAVALKDLGIDPGEVADGYGRALDVLFDAVIDAWIRAPGRSAPFRSDDPLRSGRDGPLP